MPFSRPGEDLYSTCIVSCLNKDIGVCHVIQHKSLWETLDCPCFSLPCPSLSTPYSASLNPDYLPYRPWLMDLTVSGLSFDDTIPLSIFFAIVPYPLFVSTLDSSSQKCIKHKQRKRATVNSCVPTTKSRQRMLHAAFRVHSLTTALFPSSPN